MACWLRICLPWPVERLCSALQVGAPVWKIAAAGVCWPGALPTCLFVLLSPSLPVTPRVAHLVQTREGHALAFGE